MKIKPIAAQQVSNCRYCKKEGRKTASSWHLTQENIQSCNDHKYILQEIKTRSELENNDYSEADYQTWLRF